jgi:hypothetical protein
MSALLMERLQFVKGLDPSPTPLGHATPTSSTWPNLERILFVVYGGVGRAAPGTSTLTVEACDDVVPSNRDRDPVLQYREIATATPRARSPLGRDGLRRHRRQLEDHARRGPRGRPRRDRLRLRPAQGGRVGQRPVVTGILVIGEKKQARARPRRDRLSRGFTPSRPSRRGPPPLGGLGERGTHRQAEPRLRTQTVWRDDSWPSPISSPSGSAAT